MPLWDKVRQELDRAGRAAQDAIDEGRIRLDAFRSRQLADRAAQALGYAVHRARKEGADLDADTYARLGATLAGHEAEASRLEAQLETTQARWRGHKHERPADAPPAEAPTAEAPVTAAPTGGAPGTATGAPGTATGAPGAPGAEPSAGTGPAEPWMPTI